MGKGQRNERELRDCYEAAGFRTYSPQASRWNDTDMFNLFDVLAIDCEGDRERPVHLIQVKTNGARGIENWTHDVQPFLGPHTAVRYAVKYDHDGWRLIGIDPDEEAHTTLYDERDDDRVGSNQHTDLSIGEGLIEYLRGGDGD